MEREVKPEILDSLPEMHPDALHNRRDIRRMNRLMGNHRWFIRQVKKHRYPRERFLEVGAGTGELGFLLWKEGLDEQTDAPNTGLDLISRPPLWPVNWRWIQTDLATFHDFATFPVILASMVLHQFEDAVLRALGERIQAGSRAIFASEPARRPLHLLQLRLLGRILGINYVTRHDARVSVEAGFIGDELPRLLGLDPSTWRWDCATGLRGQYRMAAVRKQVSA